MKKILFLVLIALAFIGCSNPNTSDTVVFSSVVSENTTSEGYKWEIKQISSTTANITTTQIVYSEILSNGKFVFSMTETGRDNYEVTTHVTDYNEQYNDTYWDTLKITASSLSASNTYTLNNPTIDSSIGASSSTFGFTAWYAEDIDNLKDALNFSVTYSDNIGSNADFEVDLPTPEFITAMKTYF